MEYTNLPMLLIGGIICLGFMSFVLLQVRRMKMGVARVLAAIALALVTSFGALFGFVGLAYFLFPEMGDYGPVALTGGGITLAIFLLLGLIGGPGTGGQRARPAKPNGRPAAPSWQGPPDVFISYKREERREVGLIAQRLEGLGLKVWFDAELRSGTSFDREIDRNVRAARCVLVCWSPGAVESEWVRGEATIGRQRGVLAAAMLKPADLPAPFNLVHAEDLTNGIGPSNPRWIALLERIGGLVGRPGLAPFEAFSETGDRAAIGAWLAENANDPLFDRATALLRSG